MKKSRQYQTLQPQAKSLVLAGTKTAKRILTGTPINQVEERRDRHRANAFTKQIMRNPDDIGRPGTKRHKEMFRYGLL